LQQDLAGVKAFVLKRLAASTSPPTAAEGDAMSVKELKAYLSSKGKSFAGCLEKPEIVSLTKSAL
jgi:hypothetical protein